MIGCAGTSTLTSIEVFHFTGMQRLWAFAMMARAPRLLRGVAGLRFAKVMGSGRGLGFTLRPDWNRYALLGVWENREAFEQFRTSSRLMRLYTAHTTRSSALLLRTRTAHGTWDGTNPFLPTLSARQDHAMEEVVVLTRATLRLRTLPTFWRHVPRVQQKLHGAGGFIASIGVGERPLTRQATISLWQSEAGMRAFAYGAGEEHREVVRLTREEKWYSEELFARFDLIERIGDFP